MTDLRFAIRQLRKDPGFTLAAVVTLALGIGANTALFRVFEALVLEPLPYPDPLRPVHVWESDLSNFRKTFRLVPLGVHTVGGNPLGRLIFLLVTTGLVLLVACANVAGMSLAKGARRQAAVAARYG